MKDSGSLHLKIQELCECYSNTDPLQEMSKMTSGESGVDDALKWLALAALHGVNSNASKISLKSSKDGTLSVTAEYRDAALPTPDAQTGSHIFEAMREITHIDDAKGKTPLALGMGDSSLDLVIKIKDKDGGKKLSIKFP